MRKFYDPEYDKIVSETYVRNQYNWFENNMPYLHQTFESFAEKNFIEITEANKDYYAYVPDYSEVGNVNYNVDDNLYI